jgi:wyosine [tRNA(Phe)-imidazoG37] synthetase (radical SAM superfamily)
VGNYKHIFGPVPSRRFGRSLGIDLIPFKTCSLNCIFCQLGRTTQKTIVRKEYVPLTEVIAELKDWLKTDGKADYITLSGSGEPSLHSRFGEVLEFIRTHCEIPTVLLTNGTMLHIPEVREAACHADIVKVSLSAWNQTSFRWVNRPHAELHFEPVFEGQKAFRDKFGGDLWMEVFLLSGVNSMPDDVRKIAALAREIRPDRIQLNTAVRPPAEDFAAPLSQKQLVSLAHLFQPAAEVIAEYSTKQKASMQVSQEAVLSMLRRRPCTATQITEAFGMHINEMLKYLGSMIRADQIRAVRKEREIYYVKRFS